MNRENIIAFFSRFHFNFSILGDVRKVGLLILFLVFSIPFNLVLVADLVEIDNREAQPKETITPSVLLVKNSENPQPESENSHTNFEDVVDNKKIN